jgi:hypothetical protein
MGAENPGPSLTSEGLIHPIGGTTFQSVDYFSGLLSGRQPSQPLVNCARGNRHMSFIGPDLACVENMTKISRYGFAIYAVMP